MILQIPKDGPGDPGHCPEDPEDCLGSPSNLPAITTPAITLERAAVLLLSVFPRVPKSKPTVGSSNCREEPGQQQAMGTEQALGEGQNEEFGHGEGEV